MLPEVLNNPQIETVSLWLAWLTLGSLCLFTLYEFASGRYQGNRKTRIDWAMGGISLGFLAVVQRPLLTVVVFLLMYALYPASSGFYAYLQEEHFWSGLFLYLLIDEYLHGRAHLFAHGPRPTSKWLQKVQTFYKIAHRPHHQIGGTDGCGELTATQTYVEHWGWWLILPNYWFGLICLYLGFYEWFLWGTAVKTIWGMHVHTNWGRSYDLYLLNHPNPIIRRCMFALCHIFTFPNMHHHHHARGANSAKNMTNFISVFDWLLWNTLVIEKERPARYGWRQTEREASSALYRYFHTWD